MRSPASDPPSACAAMYSVARGRVVSLAKKVASVIVGLRCAPVMGENVKVNSVIVSQFTTAPTTGPMKAALLKGP
jgi:hypothetical protein